MIFVALTNLCVTPCFACSRFGPFVIRVLDDTHLFIRIEAVDFVQQAVKDFNNKNVYTAPADQQ